MNRIALLLCCLVAAGAAHLGAQTIVYPLLQTPPTTMTSGGAADCLRGWRFQVNAANKAIYQLGCYYPDSTTQAKTVVLWTCNPAAPTTPGTILASVTTTPGVGWRWVTLPAPIALTQNAQYIVVGHTVTTSYYYAAFTPPSVWLPTGDIQYMDMRYANASGPTVYPTSVLANYQYGVVDIGYGDAQVTGPSIEVKEINVDQPGGKPVIGTNPIKFKLRNGGTQTWANVPVTVEYLINNGTPVSETFTSPLLVYPATVEYTFTTPWTATLPGPYTITVRTVPAIGPNGNTLNKSVSVFGTPTIVPSYLEDWQATDALDQYAIVKGARADAKRSTNGGFNSTHGLVMCGLDTTQAWTGIDVSNAAHRAVLDDPDQWASGGALAIPTNNYLGSLTLLSNAPGVQRVDVSWDCKIIQELTANQFSAYYVNMVFDYSTDNVTWTRAWGSGATANGIYRTVTNNVFLPTTFSITGLAGTANQQLWTRFRWVVRLTEANSAGTRTYVAVDNFSMVVPFTITTLDLPAATANVPYEYEHGTVSLTQVSGIGAVNFTATPNPAWMTLNPTSGLITGEPQAADAGILPITFAATDANSVQTSRVINFEVKPAPSAVAITNLANLPAAAENILYQYSLSAFGGAPVPFGSTASRYQWSIVTDASSAWLSIDPDTGLLSGTPPIGSLNTTANFIAVVNDNLYPLPAGESWNITSKQFALGVVEQLTILSQTVELARVGSTYRPILNVQGGTLPYTWSIVSGNLPNGLVFDPNEGQFLGTPMIGSNGIYNLTLQVADAGAQSATVQLQLVVAVAQATNQLTLTTQVLNPNTATETQPFEAWLDAEMGVPPYLWSVAPTSVDTLPAGVTIDQFGRISGSPFNGTARVYAITFQVEDALFLTSTRSFTFTVQGLISQPAITTQVLQDGEIGFSYPSSINPPANSNDPGIKVSGGTAPFTWSIVAGSLPDGLAFSAVGLISGVPVSGSEGSYDVTLRVTDASNLFAEAAFTFTIAPFSGAPLAVVAQVLPTGTEVQFYSFRVNAIGGANPTGTPTPYTFRSLGGALPAGVELDAFGQMRGTPADGTAGQYVFTVEVKDPAGFTAQSAMSLTVLPKPASSGGVGSAASGDLGGTGSGCAASTTSGSSVWLILLALASLAALAATRRLADS